jgi:hypothetical protein
MTLGPGRNVLSSGRYVAYDGAYKYLAPPRQAAAWTALHDLDVPAPPA